MANIYHDRFEKWSDVRQEYNTSYGTPKDSPVPEKVEKVIFAKYSYEDYSGSSVVIFFDQGKYWMEEGSHCSCNGLEGSWGPVEYPDAETFQKAVLDRNGLYQVSEEEQKGIFENIRAWEKERAKA